MGRNRPPKLKECVMREDCRAKLAETFSEITNIYGELSTEFPEFGNVKMSEVIEEEEKYFSSAQGFYKIAVVGSYSTGKTTLLKSLFFDRGLYEIDLPTAADITTQVPTIIKLIPGYTERCHVSPEIMTRADFLGALKWTVDQIGKKTTIQAPNFNDLTPPTLAQWVQEVAIPVLDQPLRGGSSATNEHYIRELKNAVQIFRTLDPGYKLPAINNISTALTAIKDPKASRTLRSISISIPARNITYPIQLVDLPGMDVPNLAHRQFSYKFIAEEADAVLFLKDAQKPSFTEGEQELLTHIVTKLFDIQQKCFFIFNKWHDTDHPGAEKAVREVIHKYHFQSRNIFRISALPALMYLEEREAIDIEGKYRRAQQEWAISNYTDLKEKFASKLLTEMGVLQLKEFLEYYCENSLPGLAAKNHAETLGDLLKGMDQRLIDIQNSANFDNIEVSSLGSRNFANCQQSIEKFKKMVHGVETRLDDFADSLQESLEKLIVTTEGKVTLYDDDELEDLPEGKLAKLLRRVGLGKKQKKLEKSAKKRLQDLDVPGGKETDVLFEAEDDDIFQDEMSKELIPQRPVDIMTYLIKEVFPTIDVYQRARVIHNYTAGRSKVHSHEIELAVIRDVNKALREQFLVVLVGIVGHHIEVFCRTIDNEGYLETIDTIIQDLNLSTQLNLHDRFAKFMEDFKNRLNEACEVMAEMAIKKLDEVGVYNENLNIVAAIPCTNKTECTQKQKALIEYLRKNYEKHISSAFITLREEGWDQLSEKIAKNRERLVGLLGKHHVISSKIFAERQFLQTKGEAYELALFERIEEKLRERLAVIKETAKEDMELRMTQRNAKLSEYQQKLQLLIHKCNQLTTIK